MISVRQLTRDDARACNAIVASLPYHFGNEEGRRECAEAVRSQSGFVAETGGSVTGFLTYVPHFDQAVEITWMAVHADRRRSGIGTSLIDRLLTDLRGTGARFVAVLTVSPNGDEEEPEDGYKATRAFYRAMGFVFVRELAREWPNDVAVLMVRAL